MYSPFTDYSASSHTKYWSVLPHLLNAFTDSSTDQQDVVLAITILITIVAMWYILHQMNVVKPEVIYARRKVRGTSMEKPSDTLGATSTLFAGVPGDLDTNLIRRQPLSILHRDITDMVWNQRTILNPWVLRLQTKDVYRILAVSRVFVKGILHSWKLYKYQDYLYPYPDPMSDTLDLAI
ncbi:uncharacterized protein LACBIDRAFT_336296 [Laccaria bicolor S238N-H82]|uniref:Predicted protein n=1 Tax=Laccaria bicolor (strain S238N-H82 / ATCC MYA-4686) TaxID=486041 RepID=B0E0H0_LACBS|nr:uncharacterized protein LACBIDRAFT_334830 [Laccaria bicolor S238N-H82]XP_001891277.1 uncharacterized protein LACBIDRAFT_336296 [Laccaria bicolor S238N-H82]EDQ98072.1 predicted protein [Laccaria bicolor S238N-H82]EDQ99686.1 predicted protein [Laccaria bicolor S238N-H82]|eukprot:XP_001889663.1 predicted protein [Laccaria bicolor S238N-H82]